MTDSRTLGQSVPKEGLFLMDGIEGLRSLPKHSVDILLTDPPYGTTRNYWDVPLPLPELWEAVKWAVKPNGAVLFFAQCPFDKVLGASNLAMLRYRDMKADYERQTSDISAVLTRLNAERAELANGVDNEHPALVAFMKYQNIEALNREILVELVDYIKVYENGNISVKFKFADELRKIAEYIEINTTEDTAVAG